MRYIKRFEADRTEHMHDCLGWTDCECFSSTWKHSDIYKMQQRVLQLEAQCGCRVDVHEWEGYEEQS